MRAALISSYDTVGGAALAAYRLHQGLVASGVDSTLVVRRRFSADGQVVEQRFDDAQQRFDREVREWQAEVIGQHRCGRSNTLFSLPYPGFDLSRESAVAAADVVNLHWINRLQSVESIGCLLDSGRPVVWTLHDQWPFTGGCHYADGCNGYERDCTDCPQLDPASRFIPPAVVTAKRSVWAQRLTVVSPSRWLADCARRSTVFKGCRVEVIPNGVDAATFSPGSKVDARRLLGLPPDGMVLLFTAHGLQERRKGFDLLLEALRRALGEDPALRRVTAGAVTLVVVGGGAEAIPDVGWPIRSLGAMNSEGEMAAAYRAADLLLLASLEDNLPNTMLEAMACGTPVLAFAVGGIRDVVRDGENGFLVPAGDVAAYARVLAGRIQADDLSQWGMAARETIKTGFTLERQADAYRWLFEELAGNGLPRRSPLACWPTVNNVIAPLQASFAPFRNRVGIDG